jgi:[ribosomal protein S5]-alanine N-acetyltransferase
MKKKDDAFEGDAVDEDKKLVLKNLPIETERLFMRLPTPQDALITLEFYKQNAKHLEKWEPARSAEFYTCEYWENRLQQAEEDARADRAYSFYMFLRGSSRLVGTVSLKNIERATFQNGRLGYAIGAAFEGQGLMGEGLSAIIRHAFEVLGLRRLEANVMPENSRSLRLLKKLGFREIGLDAEYLVINGQVSPHILTSLTKPKVGRARDGVNTRRRVESRVRPA